MEIEPSSDNTVAENNENLLKEDKINIIIETIKEKKTSKVARKYGKNESTLRGWKTQFHKELQAKLDAENIKVSKVPRRHRTSKFPNMERALIAREDKENSLYL